MPRHSTLQPRACLQCGEVFLPRRKHHPELQRFCSRSCLGLSRRSLIDCACLQCGTVFQETPSRIRAGRGRYCSKACLTLALTGVTDPIAHFKEHVVVQEGCWDWTARTGKPGYGVIWCQGQLLLAHRISWEIHNGPIPDGLCVLHRCDNPPCTNPSHLFLGTQGDNNRDRAVKERGSSKLTAALVLELRQRYVSGQIKLGARDGTSIADAARMLGLDLSTVRNAIIGRTWKHVASP